MTNKKTLNKEYNDFNQSSAKVPEALSGSIISRIHGDLNVNQSLLFTKLLLVHGFIGTLTLIFCPQFNLSFTHNHEFYHYIHHTYGMKICMLVCGTIFLGTGSLFAGLILNSNELLSLRKSKYLLTLAISSLALSCFYLFGAELYLTMSLMWLLGALGSSVALLEVNLWLREKLS
ncbi:hypothetical protein HBN50_01480 [Halobacteriovorax sp. GB3]|uniref:hypothetical protein n=1 Tax=Halobacteriovorax sp. GB3 TaxID=2719615 RepID=UPI00235EEE77|nr:hypothetical protein [Halobacteriovorax sp. GB3]MDD0851740.1 hypothetical protein [Halobacteriovorax sp. GB3]